MREVKHAEVEAATNELIRKGWDPHRTLTEATYESEIIVAHSPDDRYEVSAWRGSGDEILGLYSVGPVSDGPAPVALWTVGLPRPDAVPELLERHEDILCQGRGDYVLDLTSGEVVPAVVAGRLREKVPEKPLRQRQADSFREVVYVLSGIGFAVWEIRPGSDGEPDTIVAHRWGS